MKTLHTPAPWQVDYSGNCHIGIIDKNERTIAFCNLQNEDGHEDELNARLIAAAPDLLEALDWALRQLEDDLDPDHQVAFDVAFYTLRKAKGDLQ